MANHMKRLISRFMLLSSSESIRWYIDVGCRKYFPAYYPLGKSTTKGKYRTRQIIIIIRQSFKRNSVCFLFSFPQMLWFWVPRIPGCKWYMFQGQLRHKNQIRCCNWVCQRQGVPCSNGFSKQAFGSLTVYSKWNPTW